MKREVTAGDVVAAVGAIPSAESTNRMVYLSDRDWRLLVNAIECPSKPNAALLRSAKLLSQIKGTSR